MIKVSIYTRDSKPKQKQRSFLDKIIVIAAVVEPLCSIPQIVGIFRNQNASGISIFTWIGFDILTMIWIWYAIVNKQKMILIYQSLFCIFNTLIIIGAIMYGGTWI